MLSILGEPAFPAAVGREEVFEDMSPRWAAVAARSGRTTITNPETGDTFVPGETEEARTIFSVVSLFCAVLLALLLGKCPYHVWS